MGRVFKWAAAMAAGAVFALGVVACGGADDSDSSTKEAARQDRSLGESGGGIGSGGKAGNGGAKSGDDGRGEDGSGNSGFVPKEHDDSGGGSDQFRVKGGDNSVQEFGQEAEDSEREEAAAALHGFLDARAAEDWEAACSFLAREVRESLEKLVAQAGPGEDRSCAGILEKLTISASLPALRAEAARADVGSLRTEGDQAFVLYRGLGDSVLAVPMAEEGGSWKVAGLAGTPLN